MGKNERSPLKYLHLDSHHQSKKVQKIAFENGWAWNTVPYKEYHRVKIIKFDLDNKVMTELGNSSTVLTIQELLGKYIEVNGVHIDPGREITVGSVSLGAETVDKVIEAWGY